MDLMAAQFPEFKKEFRIDRHASRRLRIELYHPAANSVRIELYVPGRIQRVREIDAASIAAQLHHLRTAVQTTTGNFRMRGAAHDAAQMHGAGLLGMKRIGNVILQEFAGSPARYVKETVIERQIDIGDERRNGLESLEQRRQQIGIGGLGGNFDYFGNGPLSAVAMPNPNRSGQIFERYHHAKKTVGAAGIVRGAKLERHLLFGTQIQSLQVAALAQIPHMQRMPVAALQENVRVDAVFHHARSSPLAGDHGVVTQVPPEVVRQILRATIDFPFSQNLKAVRIHDKNSARALTGSGAKRAAKNSLGTAMHGVRAAVAGAFGEDIRFNHLDDFRTARVG